jgi:peptidoglycan hydrolase-like protein with peptidoglycan-binding domain
MTSARAAAQSQVASRSAAPTQPLVAPPAGLKLGRSGPAVKQLQAALVKLGYLPPAKATAAKGTFDRATWEALAKFKSDHGLRAVGIYGGRAAAALSAALQGQAPVQQPTRPVAPARPEAPAKVGSVDVGNIQDLTWNKAADIIRANGGKVCPNGQPTVLAVRTRNAGARQYEDFFVVLKPDGKLKAFSATTRPHFTTDSGGWTPGMLVAGNYDITPRWRDGKFNNDAFIVGTKGGMTVQIARDRNGDGRYSESEIENSVGCNEIRLHRGNGNGTPSSAGCLNVKDYDGFLKFLGGRDMRFNLTLVED